MMKRMRMKPAGLTRRAFVVSAGAGISAFDSLAASAKRPRAPFRTLYSNDTTNIMSCISPYRRKGDPLSDDRLRASIDETHGVDAQLLQPGLGWIPWWKSAVYPADDHYRWLLREDQDNRNRSGAVHRASE